MKSLIKTVSRCVLLGALFDVNVDQNKQMFQFAIEKANENLLNEEKFRLEGDVVDISYGDEFSVSRSLCGLLEVSFCMQTHFSFVELYVEFFERFFSHRKV